MALDQLDAVRGVKDWKSGLAGAVEALGAAEAAVFGRPAVQRNYRRAGRLLVAADLAGAKKSGWAINGDLKTVLRGIGHRPLATQISLLKAPQLTLPCSADVVLMKAHLRGFYVAERVTIKVPNPGRATAAARFRNEVAMRMALNDTAEVFLPALRVPAGACDADVVAEEMVSGKELPLGHSDAELAGQLLRFYAANGLRAEVLADHFDFSAGWASIRDLCARTGIEMPGPVAGWAERFAGSAAQHNGHVLCAPCNGDLTRTNLLKVGERTCIIDWEYLNHGPVCRDAVRLATQRPGFSRWWRHELGVVAAAQDAPVLGADDQLLAAAFMVIVERMDREYEFCDPASRTAYRGRLKDRAAKILALCTTVLEAPQK